MTSSFQFDPSQFKMGQRQSWNSVTQGWIMWWEPIEKDLRHLATD
jgi:hypothetical protein